MKIFASCQNKLLALDQQEVYQDLYNLGKKLNEYDIDSKSIDITECDNTKHTKIYDRIGELKTKLTELFEKYIQKFTYNDDISDEVCKLAYKYDDKHTWIVSDVITHTDILVRCLYIFEITELLNSIKQEQYYDSKFIKLNFKKKDTILLYVSEMIRYNLPLKIEIDYYNNEFRYIFYNWKDAGSLVIYAMLSEINNFAIKKPHIITCIQCHRLFVPQGKEKYCSDECKKVNAKMRKRKSRNNLKSKQENNKKNIRK